MDAWRDPKRSMKIEQHALHVDSTSHEHVASFERSILDQMDVT